MLTTGLTHTHTLINIYKRERKRQLHEVDGYIWRVCLYIYDIQSIESLCVAVRCLTSRLSSQRLWQVFRIDNSTSSVTSLALNDCYSCHTGQKEKECQVFRDKILLKYDLSLNVPLLYQITLVRLKALSQQLRCKRPVAVIRGQTGGATLIFSQKDYSRVSEQTPDRLLHAQTFQLLSSPNRQTSTCWL